MCVMALYDSSNKASQGKITRQNALILSAWEEGEKVKTKLVFFNSCVSTPKQKKKKKKASKQCHRNPCPEKL